MVASARGHRARAQATARQQQTKLERSRLRRSLAQASGRVHPRASGLPAPRLHGSGCRRRPHQVDTRLSLAALGLVEPARALSLASFVTHGEGAGLRSTEGRARLISQRRDARSLGATALQRWPTGDQRLRRPEGAVFWPWNGFSRACGELGANGGRPCMGLEFAGVKSR